METESLMAAIAASPAKRLEWAKYNFERWARDTAVFDVGTLARWEDLCVDEQAIWIDMVAMMEGKI